MTMQRYQCDYCGVEKTLPEHPTDGPQKIRTGCPSCETLAPFYAVGRARWAARCQR